MKYFPKSLVTRLQQDVALRGGLMTAAAALFSLLLLATIVWLFLVERLETRIEESLVVRHQVSLSNVAVLTDAELKAARKMRQSLPIRDDGVFSWIDHEGVVFSSNALGIECRAGGFYDGWLDVSNPASQEMPVLLSKDEADRSVHDRFRFLAKQRDKGCLVFGRSMYEVDATRDSVLRLLLWLIPLCMLPSLLISLRRSFFLRQRLLTMGRVVEEISSGDLKARIPVTGTDDIDRLSSSANRSFDRLQESVGTLQQLSSVMAHDLRAPLNRVAIPLDTAMRAAEAGKPDLESLEVVSDGLADVRTVFDALLRISQIESGRRRSEFSNVDLVDLAESIFEIYQPVVEDSERTLAFELTGEGSSLISGDADLIRQAVVNLVENATRYAPKGALIRIRVARDYKTPSLIVMDNGHGVPEEERPRVMRRLYRYEASTRGKSGHGLGLSLVKAVIELHDGEISLEDAEPGLLVRLKFKSASV